ncbi:MAG: hypothetical protein IPF54_22120, partial [Draconibacterium sp.]|nr:hypothetical protein [Draconibacterium sp.]
LLTLMRWKEQPVTVYNTATLEYVELATNTWDYLLTVPTTPGIIPIENTAFIYQSPFTIASGNSVEVITEGIDIETEVDELDTSIKRIILKKQHTNWNDTEGPNVLDGKPTIPAPYTVTNRQRRYTRRRKNWR